MKILDGYRVKPEHKLVSVTDTFYSKDGSALFCVISESISSISGVRFLTCEEVETGVTVTLSQDTIISLLKG
ncbi:hypothetical protein VP14_171 [Vibrio phage VPMCC14]|nr:hypothetical protein VP14_171 [Vibrio phage VPMCC14]